jgi:hypothetical protein
MTSTSTDPGNPGTGLDGRRGTTRSLGAGLVVLVLLLSGCQAPGGNDGHIDVDILHAHAIAFDHVTDSLYVATHHGLAKRDPAGDWSWVGDERFDLMGFTQDMVTPGTFYSTSTH